MPKKPPIKKDTRPVYKNLRDVKIALLEAKASRNKEEDDILTALKEKQAKAAE